MTNEHPSLTDVMRQKEDNFRIVVESYARMVGIWLSSTAPAVSQAVSAFAIGFALYEGVQKYLGAHWALAIIIGAVAAWAVESIGFTAVDERDQAQAHNQRTKDTARHLPIDQAQRMVDATFWATIVIVFVCEVVPAAWGLYAGTTGAPAFLFRCSLFVWPIMSRLGANLYAFRSVRFAADTSADDQELRTLQLELTKQEMIAASDLKVKTQRKNANKSPSTDSVKNGVFQGKMDDFTVNSGCNGQGKIDVANDGKHRKIAERHDAIVGLCGMYGAMSAPELSRRLMDDRGIKASAQTVGDDCRLLVDSGRLVNDGKKWNVPPTIQALPTVTELHSNGVNRH